MESRYSKMCIILTYCCVMTQNEINKHFNCEDEASKTQVGFFIFCFKRYAHIGSVSSFICQLAHFYLCTYLGTVRTANCLCENLLFCCSDFDDDVCKYEHTLARSVSTGLFTLKQSKAYFVNHHSLLKMGYLCTCTHSDLYYTEACASSNLSGIFMRVIC